MEQGETLQGLVGGSLLQVWLVFNADTGVLLFFSQGQKAKDSASVTKIYFRTLLEIMSLCSWCFSLLVVVLQPSLPLMFGKLFCNV